MTTGPGPSWSTRARRSWPKVNGREHRITRRVRAEMLAEEQARLHRLPDVAYTAAFAETRKVSWSSTISCGGVTYSVPHTLVDDQVWVRVDGDEVVAVQSRGPPRGPRTA